MSNRLHSGVSPASPPDVCGKVHPITMHMRDDYVRYLRGKVIRSSGEQVRVQETAMTSTQVVEPMLIEDASQDVVAEALVLIDRALSQMVKRELVSSGEVSDLLLDVRNLLTSSRA